MYVTTSLGQRLFKKIKKKGWIAQLVKVFAIYKHNLNCDSQYPCKRQVSQSSTGEVETGRSLGFAG